MKVIKMQIEHGKHAGAGMGLANSQLITVDLVVGIANICLLLILMYMYLQSYRQFKSRFTFGLSSLRPVTLTAECAFHRISTLLPELPRARNGPSHLLFKYNRIFRLPDPDLGDPGLIW